MPEAGRREVLAALLGVASAPLRGKEKWSLIPISDAIICGRMERTWRLPWFDGWYMWGTLRVERVLTGELREGTEISYRFLCTNCESLSILRGDPVIYNSGIWYIRKDRNGKWTSAGGGDDLGLRVIEELPGLIDVLEKTGKARR